MSSGGKALWLSGGVAAVSATFLVIWQAGRGGAPLLAAALTFGGAVVTGVVAFAGHLLNRQASLRLAEEGRRERTRLEEESLREHMRLRLDAAMQAGTLLASPDHPASSASGLLAMTQLGQADLAVALLVDLWSEKKDQVSTETAVLVIDAALRSDDSGAELIAAELLCRNAKRLNSCQSLHWPSTIDGRWNPRFGPKTKFLLLDALMQMTTATPMDRNALRSVAVRLYCIWAAEEEDANLRGCLGMAICALLPALEHQDYKDFMQGPLSVSIGQLTDAAESAKPNDDTFLAQVTAVHVANLKEWAARGEHEELALGAPTKTTVAH